ncbi:14613_t:CDS:2 [Entrophospora sp. SA101]|nr:14613_t:CDS:2 [Entrophospora sp. SA101]
MVLENQLEVVREYKEAKWKLEEFMKEENLRDFKEIWEMDELKEEKARLVKEKEVRWALYEEMLHGGKGNEQIA